MKFFLKYKRLISVVLTVTVSVMLYVSVLPASAESSNRRYGSLYVGSDRGSGDATFRNSSDTGLRFGDKYGYHVTTNVFFTYKFDSGFTVYSNSSKNSSLFFQWNIASSLKMHTANCRNDNFSVVFKLPSNRYIYASINHEAIKSQLVSSSGNPEYSYSWTPSAEAFAALCNDMKVDSVEIVGIAFKSSSDFSSIWSYISVTECEIFSGSGGSSLTGSILQSIFTPLLSWLATAINSTLRVLSDSIISQLSFLGSIFQTVGQIMQPVISTVLDNLILPVLNSVLSSLNNIVSAAVEAFSPVIAGIINFFAPYFNKIQDIITSNFLDLVSKLSPLVNEFVTAIAPSFDSVVTNISKNISSIIKECFIPSDSSKEYQEFVSLRDDVTNKFPIFSQLKGFVSVLFDPMQYKAGNSILYSNLVCSFPNKTFPIGSTTYYYRCNFNFKVNNSYYITFNFSGTSGRIQYIRTSGGYMSGVSIKNGSNSVLFSSDINVSAFEFVVSGSSDSSTLITDICLYSVDSSAGEDFTVNVYGKKVSVLDFDWYMPYKHYGDICVIAFCYLAFIWHTFKKLPSII